MEWFSKISKGWIVGTAIFTSPLYAEPREVLYTALLEMAENENLPALNGPAESFAPPVAPSFPVENALELPPLQEEPKLAPIPSRLKPTNDILPLDQIPSREPEPMSVGEREVIQERYPNGVIKIERQVIQDATGNYVHDGSWRWFNSKGQIVAEGEFTKGVRDGIWRRMHRKEDSPIFATAPYRDFEPPFLSEAVFENGKLNGPWMITDSKNRKISEINFENGVRHGTATWWHVQGAPMIQTTFERGELHGDLFTFTAAGKTANHDTFDHGQKFEKQTDKYPDGKVKVVAGTLSGHWKLTGTDEWWTASVSKFEVVGKPIKHGKVVTYHRNGNMQSEQEYSHGKPIGQATWWHENGQKALIGTYNQEGLADGRWTWWHENGLRKIEGDYLAGAPHGKWLAWDKTGRVSLRSSLDESQQEVIATKPSSTPSNVIMGLPTKLGQPRPTND